MGITSITDQNKNIVQSYDYDSFGMVKANTSFRNAYAYTGREWDKEAGLYYYNARYYDPIDGRFISKDPISFAGGDVNLYGYVQNNPVNYTDPTGLFYSQAQQLAALLTSFVYNLANMSPGKPAVPMALDYAGKKYDDFMNSLKTPPIDPFSPPPPGWTYDPISHLWIPPTTPVICGGK
jgi:RHS repeat-associated protein